VRIFPPLVWGALFAKIVAIALWFMGQPTAAMLVFFAPDPFVLYAMLWPPAQGLGRVYTHFDSEHPAVWLTIDDGPDEQDTPQILDLLERAGARATFFIVGERAARLPHLVTEIVRRGHQIAHHTHTHPAKSFWGAAPGRLAAELDRLLEILRPLGIRPQFFRPPVGIKNFFLAHALAARGMQCVGWSVRSGDCHDDSPERIVKAMTTRLKSGTIILVHEGPGVHPAVRVRAIALLLDTLTARKLACVVPDVSQLR
jgi:peptidoglycan-N-acetylglucosamine deacetylase